MKKILVSMMLLGSLGLFSCQDMFLQMPDTTGTVDLKEVYGSAKNAKSALMTCYRQSLLHGLPGGWGVGHGTLGALCGEVSRGYSWHGTYTITQSGLDVNGTDGSDAGSEHFGNNWAYIRDCFLVKTNIDRVPDMTQEEKDYIKAEVTALIAYRYMGMFYRYGGLPIVRKDFANAAEPAVNVGRSSLEDTLDYILELCDEAYDGLPEGDWSAADQGRMTRGAVLAIKARTLLFAARPLFNSATPYLSGAHDELVCFGSTDETRWQQAIEANEAVLAWAAANNYALINTGAAGEGQPNPNAFDDYATATSTPANREVLLAYKNNDTNMWSWPASAIFYYNNYSPYWGNNRYDTDQSGLMTNFLEFYYKADGSDYANWPKLGEPAPRPVEEWLANIEAIEPRAKADNIFIGFDAFNNQGQQGQQLPRRPGRGQGLRGPHEVLLQGRFARVVRTAAFPHGRNLSQPGRSLQREGQCGQGAGEPQQGAQPCRPAGHRRDRPGCAAQADPPRTCHRTLPREPPLLRCEALEGREHRQRHHRRQDARIAVQDQVGPFGFVQPPGGCRVLLGRRGLRIDLESQDVP